MTEAQIRDLLVARLSGTTAGQGAAFISEMFVEGFQRRADLVLANGILAVFEIKSDRDTLDRLDGQLECYKRAFESVTVVCAERHLKGVLERAGKRVGVWAVAPDGSLTTVRHAQNNGRVSKVAWLGHLPVDEIRALLRTAHLAVSGSRQELVSRASALSREVLRQSVLDYLKRREQRISDRRSRIANVTKLRPQVLSREERLMAYLRLVPTIQTTAIPRVVRQSESSSMSSSSS